jgi:hypothetical protein
LVVVVSIKSTFKTLEVHQEDPYDCDLEYKIRLPYEAFAGDEDALEPYLHYVFEGLIIALKNHGITEESLRTLQAEIRSETLNNPDYAYPKPLPTYADLQLLLKERGITDKHAYRKSILEKLKQRYNDGLDWRTPNDQLHTRLFNQPGLDISRSDLVELKNNELPLLECQLPNDNYFLMTTDYVYSYFMHYLRGGAYHRLKGFHPSTQGFNDPLLENKTELYSIVFENKTLLFFEIDSNDPGRYAQDLFRIMWEREEVYIG